MDASAIINIVLTAVSTAVKVWPTLVQAKNDLEPFAHALYQELTGQVPTDDQRTVIRAGIEALFARLETPLPPAQPGDPDYKPPS